MKIIQAASRAPGLSSYVPPAPGRALQIVHIQHAHSFTH